MPYRHAGKASVEVTSPHGANFLADGTAITKAAFWHTVTGVATTDPDYQRAQKMCARRLDDWFKGKYPRIMTRLKTVERQFHARRPLWSHVLADYCLWAAVSDDLKPKEWPRSSAKFADAHRFSMGELATLLQRVRFKSLFERLYPPIPTYLLVQKVDRNLFNALAKESNWDGPDKDLKAMNGLANTFYTRYGVIKKGGSLNIVNNNVASLDSMREVPADVLHESLKLVLPFLKPDELEAVGLLPVPDAEAEDAD